MAARDLKNMFNLIAAPAFNCSTALLGMERSHDTEWQRLTFSGTKATGGAFTVQSGLIRPGADVNSEAANVARKLIADTTAAAEAAEKGNSP